MRSIFVELAYFVNACSLRRTSQLAACDATKHARRIVALAANNMANIYHQPLAKLNAAAPARHAP
jgi:hypothetical protein